MMRRMFKGFNRANSGFTIVELAFSMTISSLLIGGLVTSIHHLISLPPRIQANSVVMQQAQNLSYWLSRDAQMIQTFTAGDSPVTSENEALTFSWVCMKRTDGQDNDYIDTFLVRYLYESGRLSRCEKLHTDKYNSNGELIGSTDSQKMMVVAEHVSGILGSLVSTGLKVSATFSYSGTQVERTYDITPRANILN